MNQDTKPSEATIKLMQEIWAGTYHCPRCDCINDVHDTSCHHCDHEFEPKPKGTKP